MLTVPELVARELREDRRAEAVASAYSAAARSAARERRAARRLEKLRDRSAVAQSRLTDLVL
jgi:hypothetical protein